MDCGLDALPPYIILCDRPPIKQSVNLSLRTRVVLLDSNTDGRHLDYLGVIYLYLIVVRSVSIWTLTFEGLACAHLRSTGHLTTRPRVLHQGFFVSGDIISIQA